MATHVVDTNLIVRAITFDHPDHSLRARALFDELADGAASAVTSGEVIAEAVFVLSSPRLYGLTRLEIERELSAIIRLPYLELPNSALYLEALRLYASTPRVKFVDAIVAAIAKQRGIAVMSFDQGFDGLAGVNRTEPAPI